MVKDQSVNPDPLAPTKAEAIGFNDRRFDVTRAAPEHGTLVPSGHAKVSQDPSEGTATSRPQTMERSGARYRVHPLTSAPNTPYSAATQANGRVVGTSQPATDYAGTKDYGGGEVEAFDDAGVAGSIAPGQHRVRGWTSRG